MSTSSAIWKVARRRKKIKGRTSEGSFVGLQHHILKSAEFGSLSAWAVKLLMEMAKEFKGTNNGNFSASFSVLRTRGWRSPGTLSKALKELEEKGWIVKTRQGGRRQCSLFGITWWPIDDGNGKHDYAAEIVAKHDWKKSVVAIRIASTH